jgi:hypothetical protein
MAGRRAGTSTMITAAAAAVLAATAAVAAPASAAPRAAAAGAVPQVRVNQAGYALGAPKVAFAMLPRPVAAVRFTVARPDGTVVFRGRSATDLGRWNARYGAVYRLGFSGLTRIGQYRVTVQTAGGPVSSPAFRVDSPAALYQQLAGNGVRYFTSERDGPDVDPSVLDRQPANLTDRRAFVYAPPRFDGNDNILGTFHRIGGPVNVAGGWFDAGGGYEKFAYTASYADGLLLLAARDFPGRYPGLGGEAHFGLSWLQRLWRPDRKVLYMQVGVGTGNASNTIQGDYNFWFLPQAEDKLDVSPGGNPGPTARFVKYRPVFAAAAPGHKFSPPFAGRFAADFALGAQLAARGARPRARHLLGLARGVYAMAKTKHVGQLLTAYPHDFYPGTEWRSAMLWGAAEIALADEATGVPRAQLRADLATAGRWAHAYVNQKHSDGDTLNLYDNGALGEAELLRAMRQAGGPPVIAPARLLGDMAVQLRMGQRWARTEPFGLGSELGNSDATPHAFGLFITNALYRMYGGSARFQGLAQQQLNFALGANAWGTSFTVGAGSTFPHCMQSEIANLSGSLTGQGALQLGATSDGPSAPGNFYGLGTVSGMRACSAGHFRPFDSAHARYEDNVVSWPSVEPAADYSANALLAFALAAG